ncbi:hypothetical protein PG989_002167 [Apiospora arundinis]
MNMGSEASSEQPTASQRQHENNINHQEDKKNDQADTQTNQNDMEEDQPPHEETRHPTFTFPPDQTKTKILKVLEKIRQCDVHHDIDIPELVLCGKQSSGKSSVLEAITGLELPKADAVPCTRFAIEIQLFPDAEEPYYSSKVRFEPVKNRDGVVTSQREDFQLPNFSNVGRIIQEAGEVMGISETNIFSRHVLSIDYHFPDPEARVNAPRLTLVDLPGLIAVDEEKDVESLTNRYIKRGTALILAVVDAVDDPATQQILRLTRKEDPECLRTHGIITKPDMTQPSGDRERMWVQELSAQNPVYFKTGCHVLCNRGPRQITQGDHFMAYEHRDQQEIEFFRQTHRQVMSAVNSGGISRSPSAWNELIETQNWGIKNLRKKLLELLSSMAVRQLDIIYAGISEELKKKKDILEKLKIRDPEEQKADYREFVNDIRDLANQASTGTYLASEFFVVVTDGPLWLRSRIIEQGNEFAKKLRAKGHEQSGFDWKPDESLPDDPHSKDATRMLELMLRTQSGPHPADFSPDRINLVFRQYSIGWNAIAKDYVESCHRCAQDFVREAVRFVIKNEGVATQLLAKEVLKALEKRKDAAFKTLMQIETDRGDAALTMNPDMWMGTSYDHSIPLPATQRPRATTNQAQNRSDLGTQAKTEFEELESVRRVNALRLLRQTITLYKVSLQCRRFSSLFSQEWLDDKARFEAIMEEPDKENREKTLAKAESDVKILTEALQDLEPLIGT